MPVRSLQSVTLYYSSPYDAGVYAWDLIGSQLSIVSLSKKLKNIIIIFRERWRSAGFDLTEKFLSLAYTLAASRTTDRDRDS